MLEVRALHAGYGTSRVLHGVDLCVGSGEIVALLGRNGSGRSTVAKALMGLVVAEGSVRWHGRELVGERPYEIARAGLGYVPEGRDVFPTLTVHQNLLLGQKRSPVSGNAWTFDEMYALFPALVCRRDTEAGVLSGGEQQMLTLCRTMMGGPQLVIIDEPTEGLAPQVVEQVASFLKTLRSRGVSVLLIEQKLTIALTISDRIAVMGQGRVVFEGAGTALLGDSQVRQEWLEV